MTCTELPEEIGYSLTGETMNNQAFCCIHYKGNVTPFSLKGEILTKHTKLNASQINLVSEWIRANRRRLSYEWYCRRG